MLHITLPDGSQREFPGPVTVAEVAASIGAGLAKAALAGKIGDRVVDTSHLITEDSPLAIVTAKDADGWRSFATPPPTCWPTPSKSCSRTRRSP